MRISQRVFKHLCRQRKLRAIRNGFYMDFGRGVGYQQFTLEKHSRITCRVQLSRVEQFIEDCEPQQ